MLPDARFWDELESNLGSPLSFFIGYHIYITRLYDLYKVG